MENLTDKELLRQGRYEEALGENYVAKSISVMLFKSVGWDATKREYKGGHCVDGEYPAYTVKKTFYSVGDAKEWVKKNMPELPNNMWYTYWDCNSDWL